MAERGDPRRQSPERAIGPGEDHDGRSRRPARRSSSGSGRSATRPRCSSAATSRSCAASPRRPASRWSPCTGIYTYDHLPTFFVSRDPDQIADMFVADIEEGIQGTEIKAAFIKCAADEPGVTENVEKVHRAVARASVRTGAPIMAHSRPASDTGPAAGRDLRGGGRRPLARVQIAHCGDTRRRRLHRAPARARASTSASTATGSRCSCPTSSARPSHVALLERGYADRIFLSADSCATIDWFPPEVGAAAARGGAGQGLDITARPRAGASPISARPG